MTCRFVALVTISGILASAGCQSSCCRPGGIFAPAPKPLAPGLAPVPFPGATPLGQPPTAIQPPTPIGPPPSQSLPPPAPPGQNNLIAPYPPTGPNGSWDTPKKQIQLSPPEPMKPLPDEAEELDPIKATPDPAQKLPAQPPTKPKVTTTEDPLPSGIAQFAVALPNVTAGLRPMLDGGLDWLQKKNYQTVLHLKRPGEDDSADRKQVEKRGLKYESLDVSPNTPLEPVLQQFAKIVADKSGRPLFVYDKDGSLAGALWYLYFRVVEEYPDDVARVRANALGLRMDGEGPHYEMWIAVQKYLADKK